MLQQYALTRGRNTGQKDTAERKTSFFAVGIHLDQADGHKTMAGGTGKQPGGQQPPVPEGLPSLP